MQMKIAHTLRNRVYVYFSRCNMSSFNYKSCIDVSPEVSKALRSHTPVVALESTIISHGMPYPQNLQTALQVEEIVRNEGAVPATVAIVKGRIKVGLNQEMLAEFASLKTPVVKTSRRDFPYVLSKGLNGGTTVAGTVIVSSAVGIKVFATGGLGGVHRGGEKTMDVSADLMELGRNPVAVVSSGVKSILDIERTLEYLETQGVCVVTFGENKNFPSFYTPRSGVEAPYNIESPVEAALLIEKLFELHLNSGILLAVPIPDAEAIEGNEIEKAISTAVKEAEDHGIKGKEVTPFVLNRVISLTGGRSLESNIALIKNNAKVGAQVALELAKRQMHSSKQLSSEDVFQSLHAASSERCAAKSSPVVVIGGSVLDSVLAIKENSILANGSTHAGQIRQSGGGVGRNIADALGKLGTLPFLISAIGNDYAGDYLVKNTLKHIETSGLLWLDHCRTACYSAIVNKHGECYFGVGDMVTHDYISPKLVDNFLDEIKQSSLVVLDGNIPVETMDYVLAVCKKSQIPVWFEPTDIRKAGKVFQSRHWTTLGYVSPNLNELQVMSQASDCMI
ncbi:uncharacterized protein LOC110828757 isoform X3 [Zootermopsis nevadensis]|uniref:uncharacterized protein LOC110828757 isoform X3 n=1 Tax=Zootermopsis nevadensis TaxID=136037 RepID=UPI000B8EB15E|nr:uncharacterized protein LOC110828757 isoform X3 [Zootermopsis nevadensis]